MHTLLLLGCLFVPGAAIRLYRLLSYCKAAQESWPDWLHLTTRGTKKFSFETKSAPEDLHGLFKRMGKTSKKSNFRSINIDNEAHSFGPECHVWLPKESPSIPRWWRADVANTALPLATDHRHRKAWLGERLGDQNAYVLWQFLAAGTTTRSWYSSEECRSKLC